jgi:hypothetical protein
MIARPIPGMPGAVAAIRDGQAQPGWGAAQLAPGSSCYLLGENLDGQRHLIV